MTTKYKTSKWSENIERIECHRETAQTVWYFAGNSKSERRQLKQSDYETIHDSWDAARDSLVSRATRAIEGHTKRLAAAEKELSAALAMTNPESES